MKLMRIIPDNAPGYSDTLVTVKRYLLDGAASAFCAVVFRAFLPFSPLTYRSSEERNRLGTCLQTPIPELSFYLSQMPTGKASTD